MLYKNDNVGAIDVAIDPVNPQIVYASLWNTRRPPWYVYGPSNGPGGGIFKSTDGGTTWNQLTNGLPAEGVGRIGLAISPSNPKIVYAVIDAKEGGLFRSNDAGATWTKTTGDTRVWGRGWYFEKVAVDPKNPDVVYVPNVGIQRSTDGGKTFSTWAMRGSPGGDDYQGVMGLSRRWEHPDRGERSGCDHHPERQRRDAAVELVAESADCADLPRVRGLSLSVLGDRRAAGQRRRRGAHARQVRRDLDARLGADLRRRRERHDRRRSAPSWHLVRRQRRALRSRLNGNAVNLPPPAGPEGPRRDWTQPLTFSRADPRVLYYADQYLYRTMTGSTTWTRISDDLTRPDPGIPQTLDAAAAALTDRNGKRGVIYTIAPSPVLRPMVWIGTDDGLIQMTMNEGKTWQNVTPPPLTAWSRVTTVEASHTDFNEAYASVDRHQLEDFDPHIYRTRDSGKTWQTITNGLPGGVYAHVVKEDPRRRGLLFAGTERGIYVSFNDGDAWQPLQLNLPVTSVRDVEIHGDDLIVATHGRGFWMIDDITPLRHLDDAATVDVFLFEPAEAISVIAGGDNGTPLQKDEPQAENPPVGAYIDYYLKSAASGPVTLEILDGNGQPVRAYSSSDQLAPATPQTVTVLWNRAQEPLSAAAGMHRFVWDLRRAAVEGGGRGRGGRGGGGGGVGRGGAPLSGPGSYTVKLTVNGKSYTRALTVRRDPRDR